MTNALSSSGLKGIPPLPECLAGSLCPSLGLVSDDHPASLQEAAISLIIVKVRQSGSKREGQGRPVEQRTQTLPTDL